MNAQSRKYYYDLQIKETDRIQKEGIRPSLLMHTCCAVCACYPIRWLDQFFDLTLYYNNDNIYPESEYDKRYGELVRYVSLYNQESGSNVRVIKTPFDGENYTARLQPLKDEPEGGARCRLCYSLRMDKAMKFAEENRYDYFTTVMTVSRQKDSRILNEIGAALQVSYPKVRYFYSDFKKNGGLEKGQQLVKQYGIYSQNYCGCVFSYQEMLQRARKDYDETKD